MFAQHLSNDYSLKRIGFLTGRPLRVIFKLGSDWSTRNHLLSSTVLIDQHLNRLSSGVELAVNSNAAGQGPACAVGDHLTCIPFDRF